PDVPWSAITWAASAHNGPSPWLGVCIRPNSSEASSSPLHGPSRASSRVCRKDRYTSSSPNPAVIAVATAETASSAGGGQTEGIPEEKGPTVARPANTSGGSSSCHRATAGRPTATEGPTCRAESASTATGTSRNITALSST